MQRYVGATAGQFQRHPLANACTGPGHKHQLAL